MEGLEVVKLCTASLSHRAHIREDGHILDCYTSAATRLLVAQDIL